MNHAARASDVASHATPPRQTATSRAALAAAAQGAGGSLRVLEARTEPVGRELELIPLLNAFEQPAYLLSWTGAPLFANEAAQRGPSGLPAWVGRFARLDAHHGAPAGARRVKLGRGNRELWLITTPPDRQSNGADWSPYPLGPSRVWL